MDSIKKILIPILICSVLISCSASRHAGITHVKQPLLSEEDENKWFAYYQDRFDANKGEVVLPTAQYPKSAHEGYKRAEEDWNRKVQKANTATGIFLAVTIIFLGAVAVIEFQSGMSDAKFSFN